MSGRTWPRWRRRHFLVDRKIQLRFAFLVVVQMAFGLALVFLLTRYHLASVRTIVKDLPGMNPGQTESLLLSVDRIRHLFNIVFLLGVLPALLWSAGAGVFASHKLAGSMLRLRRSLAAAVEGSEPQPLRFRRSDRLEPLTEVLSRSASSFRARRGQIDEVVAELASGARALGTAANPAASLEIISSMEEQIGQLAGLVTRGEGPDDAEAEEDLAGAPGR